MNDSKRWHSNSEYFELPPIAVICGTCYPENPRIGVAPSSPMFTSCIAALDAIEVFSSLKKRYGQLHSASAALQGLAQQLSAYLPDGNALKAESPLHDYFRVRPARLSPVEEVAAASNLLSNVLADLAEAPVAGIDLQRLLIALRRLVLDLAGTDLSEIGAAPKVEWLAPASAPGCDTHRWRNRWIIAHQFHAAINTYAAYALSAATEAAAGEEFHLASKQLRRAEAYVEAFAPARSHALAVPAQFYVDVIRPTMAPPFTVAPLSGRAHVEYSAYRARLTEHLERFPISLADLVPTQPEYAFAREALLEADLVDAERHVTLVEPVVGLSKSIVQSARSSHNAVSALRAERQRRARTFRPFVRYGDPVDEV